MILTADRLREKGAEYLGDAELLTLIIGSQKTSRDILNAIGGIRNLQSSGTGTLCEIEGIGLKTAAKILAAVELGIRVSSQGDSSEKRFSCSADIYKRYSARLSVLKQEVMYVVGLNNKNQPIVEKTVAMGSVTECRVNPREIFRPLIAEACARMIMLHNHPSGDSIPSPEDISLTRRVTEAGSLLGIPMLDHLVVGSGSYSSLRDMGIISGK